MSANTAGSGRLLIVSFDALRPDMVTPELMPNLCRFAELGTSFPHARATYPTETRVNQTSLITGCHPGRHGIVGNKFFDPEATDGLLNTGDESQLRAADDRLGGKLIGVPTIGEMLTAQNKRFASISTGTPGGARILHHAAERIGGFRFSLHRPDATVPADAYTEISERFGPVPPHAIPSLAWLAYGTDVYLDWLEPRWRPDATILWFCEPDNSYHAYGPGSPESLAAMRETDRQFGRILDRLDAMAHEDRPAIITMSDHGQLTTAGDPVDVAALLADAGFACGDTDDPEAAIRAVTGTSGGLYLRGSGSSSDSELAAELLAWLQEQAWCGPVFTRDGHNALRHADLELDHLRAPDIGLILKSDDETSVHDTPGQTRHSGIYPTGGGTHGGLHHRELSSWLALSAPAAHQGFESPLPCGVVDILPTALHLMGIAVPDHIQGRVLAEAFPDTAPSSIPPEPKTIIADAKGAAGHRSFLSRTKFGGRHYLERGWSEREGQA